MAVDLIINSTKKYNNIAVLEDNRLTMLNRELKDSEFLVGDFYLGRVNKIMPGLNAAFIDVGYTKDAFLHYSDLGVNFNTLSNYLEKVRASKGGKIPAYFEEEIPKEGKISDVLKANTSILVQVNKEPISSKGPRLSCDFSMAGRYLILVPFSNQIAISQKIRDRKEKERLQNLIESIRPKGFGVICRTVSVNKQVADLHADLNFLTQRWEKLISKYVQSKPPQKVLGEVGRSHSLLRDLFSSDFNEVHVDDEELYQEVQDYIGRIAPSKQKIIKHYTGQTPILDKYNVTQQVKKLFGKKVMLPGGGYLIIEHTEAMHVIDVNSGNLGRKAGSKTQEESVLEINLAAAKEIVIQLKLRDMGGIIVVDFIDMSEDENNKKLYQFLKENMQKDRAKHNILPPTKIGLVQITRQRVRPEMNIKTSEQCPCCDGKKEVPSTLMLVDEIKASVQDFISKKKVNKVVLKTHPYIASFINQPTGFFRSMKKDWQKEAGCKIELIPTASLSFLAYKISS